MKKVLIINLRRLGDVYSTAHLVNSLAHEGNVEISLLTYKESLKAAKNLAHVKNIYTIDRHELATITTNKLFTDTYALDRLVTSVDEVKNQQWDTIVNYSNDTVAAYLCSYLKSNTEKVVGVHFNENRNIETNSTWEIVFNDILPTMKQSPVHFVDCYHKMMNVSVCHNGEKITLSSAHNETAMANITDIRNSSPDPKRAKVIAIQVAASSTTKSLGLSTLNKYIQLLIDAGDFIPMLMIAPTNEEREMANTLNGNFNNELIVVESDLNAVASVLANVDLVVTPDTVVKHIADLVDSPVLEISLGEAPFLKQGSFNRGSLVLTNSLGNRSFKGDDQNLILANDIFASTIYYFSNSKSIKPTLSNGVALYKASHDDVGVSYVPVAGTIDARSEISRLMSRQFITSLIDGVESENLYQEIVNLGTGAVINWCNDEKSIITEVMRDLLGTLRSLLQSVETKRNSREFVMNLGKLISHCENESTSQIATIIFKTRIEGINARSFEENAKQVENLLYELKGNLQKNLASIKTLEDKALSQKKDDFMTRNNPTLG